MAHPLSECLTMAWACKYNRGSKVGNLKRGFPLRHRDIQLAKGDSHRYLGPCSASQGGSSSHQLPDLHAVRWLGAKSEKLSQEHPIPKYLGLNWQHTGELSKISMPPCLDRLCTWIRNEWLRNFSAEMQTLHSCLHDTPCSCQPQIRPTSAKFCISVWPLPDPNPLPHPVRIEGSCGHRFGQGEG